jgi:hypothetical protein
MLYSESPKRLRVKSYQSESLDKGFLQPLLEIFIILLLPWIILLKTSIPPLHSRMPAIKAAGIGNPGWEDSVQVVGKGKGIRFVCVTKF